MNGRSLCAVLSVSGLTGEMTSRRGGWSITDNERSKRVGVVASSLSDLIAKSVPRLGLTKSYKPSARDEFRCYVSEDGTRVVDDDYLFSLANHTSLVIVKRRETMKTENEHKLSQQFKNPLSGINVESIIETISNSPKVYHELLNAVERVNCRADQSSMENDPEWFKGIKPPVMSKEEYMRKNVKQRINSYFYKVSKALVKDDNYTDPRNLTIKHKMESFIELLKSVLSERVYNQSYFDRSAKTDKMCDGDGKFACGGNWNCSKCDFNHTINPYSNYEKRIVFSTWNLDHKIELSRSIIPSIIEVISSDNCQCQDRIQNLAKYYYNLIFTTENLKLVNIVCHDKKSHDSFEAGFKKCTKCN